MRISRREFVGNAAGAVGGLYLWPVSGDGLHVHRDGRDGNCVVLDLGAGCALQESLQGYQEALGTNAVSVREFRNWRRSSFLIVPGIAARTATDAELMRMLLDFLAEGKSVLLESGAGFSSTREFGGHCEMLRNAFEIEAKSAVDVWGRAESGARFFAPYVEYVWPCKAMVRDFSRVIPVADTDGATIASAGELAVATRKSVGKGTLIFLGSPLGPALLAGDLQAKEWLLALRRVSSEG